MTATRIHGVFVCAREKTNSFVRFDVDRGVYGPFGVAGVLDDIVRHVWLWLGVDAPAHVPVPLVFSAEEPCAFSFLPAFGGGAHHGTFIDDDALTLSGERFLRLTRPVPLDVNRAALAQLAGVPGLGPSLAAKIVAARVDAPFANLDELARVAGLGPKRRAQARVWLSA